MPTTESILSSVEFWKFVVPLLGAVVAWLANEWQKRIAQQYERKEQRYKELLSSLRGFYVGAANAEALMAEFLVQLNISWMYCPDDVIRKAYAFLDTVRVGERATDEQKEFALGTLVVAIRADSLARTLVHKTSLKPSDFRHQIQRPT
jgi:hypothetical protein